MSVAAASWHRLCALFEQALALPPEQRGAFADQACGADEGLRQELQALLRADAAAGPLSHLVGQAAAGVLALQADALVGQRIGPYEVQQLLGAGGMGRVYRARRADAGFEQVVALKVLPPSQGGAAFLQRFQAERRVLAQLEHPGIVHLIDGGVSADGLHYLVMEHVDGSPIDVHCRTHGLDVRARLRLFVDVCAAVEHAHRRLIVHCDLKPGNVFVSAAGQVKLLDFGIAKVIHDESGGEATQLSQRLLTPHYASPEQLRGEPVTTATDVYALGVLLVRLLTGRLPYRVTEGHTLGLLRAIVEQPVARPSALALADGQARLGRQLRGDLDTIALMALRKEPERRYASVQALREDVERHLDHRPVRARGESWRYSAVKLLRRHPLGVPAALGAAVLALAGTVQIVAQRDEARSQAATAQRVAGFLNSMLAAADPYAQGGEPTARALLARGAAQIDRELAGDPLVAARLKRTMARAYASLGQSAEAARLATESLAGALARAPGSVDELSARVVVAEVAYQELRDPEARDAARQALALAERLSPGATSDTAAEVGRAHGVLGRALLRLDQAEPALAEVRAGALALQQALGVDHPDALAALSRWSAVLTERGRHDEARQLAQQVVDTLSRSHPPDALVLAEPLSELGRANWVMGRFHDAATLYRRQVAIIARHLGDAHPVMAGALSRLAITERKLGDEKSAAAHLERAIAVLEGSSNPPAGRLARLYGDLGILHADEGRVERGLPLVRRALELAEQAHGPDSAELTYRLMHMGVVLRKLKRHDEARTYLQRAIDVASRRYGPFQLETFVMRRHLAYNDGLAGRHAQARRALEPMLQQVAQHLGPDHPERGQGLIDLAEIELLADQPARAEALLAEALPIYRARRAPGHPDLRQLWLMRADAADRLHHPDLAQAYRAEAAQVAAAR